MKLIRKLYFKFLSLIPGIKFMRVKLKHLEMYIDVKTPGISNSLFINKSREDDMIFLIKKYLPFKGDIIDCGSNIGFYPLLEERIAKEKRKIICIEPDPRNILLLKKNIETFSYDSNTFKLCSGAVSESNGKMNLDISRASNLNFISNSKKQDGEYVEVETFTLDTLIRKFKINPTFLRMDIEGHEVSVFNGAAKWAKESEKGTTILFETHAPLYENLNSLKNSLTSFREMGFCVKCLVSSGGSGPEIKKRWGFNDGDKIISDGFLREMFWDVDFNLACEIASTKPKLTRYMLLIKE
jgi:FkbM family methyltransferase